MIEKSNFMTIQQAAAEILKKNGSPMKSKELAKQALELNMVAPSKAKDPIQSMSQTLERNIRMNTGNKPQLKFIYTKQGRYISLPKTDEIKKYEECTTQLIKIELSKSVLKKIKIYEISENYKSLEDTIVDLIKKGLESTSEDFIEKLKNEFK